jgi:hypothetical protein
VLIANLVAVCMSYGDAYHSGVIRRMQRLSSAWRVVRQSQIGNYPLSVVRNVQAVIDT